MTDEPQEEADTRAEKIVTLVSQALDRAALEAAYVRRVAKHTDRVDALLGSVAEGELVRWLSGRKGAV